MRLPKRLYIRRFLNRPRYHTTAYVLADASVTRDDPTKHTPDPKLQLSAELTLSDCDRKITLDFNFWDGHGWGDLRNLQHKSATLRKAVNDFLDHVDRGAELIEAELLAKDEE